MKKFLCAAAVLLLAAGCVFSLERQVIRLGLLSKLNTTEEEFSEVWKKTFAPKDGALQIVVKFYDSLTAMQMALSAREIHEMVLPEAAAEYVLNVNDQMESTLALRSKGMGLAFGFRGDNEALRDKFNSALREMRDNWTLAALEGVYISRPGRTDPEPVKFTHFDGAETIRVAVTGDLPPIDLIAADGTPAGFNTAVLAKIGEILHVNIEPLEVDSGARTAALASGRADAVFWYEINTALQTQPDIPEGVIISEPYYEWNKFIHIRKAPPKSEGSRWSILDSILNLYHIGD